MKLRRCRAGSRNWPGATVVGFSVGICSDGRLAKGRCQDESVGFVVAIPSQLYRGNENRRRRCQAITKMT